MHISWIDVMLEFVLLLVCFNLVHGKAFLEDEGQQSYYSEIGNPYRPTYQNRAANPKLFYTPRIDGQPIYIPAISGSEHVNKFLDDYYKINRDYTQSWTLAPPVTYDYDITSENSYYENGVTTNSMVKNFLEEKYKDGAYSSYVLPASPGNLPELEKTTDHKIVIEHKDPGNKKTHNRKKKRPHGISTEGYFTQYKIKTEIPEDYSKALIKASYKKQGDKRSVPLKSSIPEVHDYDETNQISTFELQEEKTKDKHVKSEISYSEGIKIKHNLNKKDKKHQSAKHKNKSKSEPVSKSYAEDYITNSNLIPSIKEKTTETSKYSTNKVKNTVSVGKKKIEVDAINKLSDKDYEPEVVDVINELSDEDYEPEVVDVINELSDEDYEPEVLDVNELSNEDYQDADVIKVHHTEKHLVTDTEDYDESTNNVSLKKENNKKHKNKEIDNRSIYSKVENEKPKKIKHQSVKVDKPNKHPVKDLKDSTYDTNLHKSEKTVQSPKTNSKKTKNKIPVHTYEPDVLGQVKKLSEDYEPDAVDEVELSDDYDPEIIYVVDKLSDLGTEDVSELSDFDESHPRVDMVNEESFQTPKPEEHLKNDETFLDTFTSEKEKAEPSKPVKAEPSKPVKAEPSKPVKAEPSKPVKAEPSKPVKAEPSKPVKAKPNKPEKTKDHNKNIDKYDNKSEIKTKGSQLSKIEKDKTKQKYESDEHIMKGKDQSVLAGESVIENQTDPKEMHSRDLLNEQNVAPNKVEEFDGSGSQAIDTNLRSIPQFFKNVESIRNLTSINSNIWSLIFNPNDERNELKRCVTRSNETGICMYVQQCEVPNIAATLEQLLNNACVIDDMFIGVCCPEFPVQTVKVHWDEMPSNSDKLSEDEFGHSAEDCGIRSDDAKKAESWPWQAPLLSMSNGKIFCAGVVINDDYILTAAHCTTKIPKNQILVRLGQHDETSGDDFAVVEIKRHAQYNPRNMQNDIALLKLGKRIMRDKHIDVVCLPDNDDDHEDEKAVLLGRKRSFSQNSKPTEWLKVMSNADCEQKLGSKVPTTLLCTDARDENERTCNLDSGAPLVVEDDGKYEVIGILSWNRNDCDERFPSTFSRVSKYVRWIQKHAV